MKIAMCISGHMRTYDKVYENLKKYILSKYDIDIYISTWNYKDNQSNKSIGYIKDEDIINLYGDNLKSLEIENYDEKIPEFLSVAKTITKNIGPGCQPIRAFPMFYKNYKAINLIKEHNYDIVIKTRPDLIYSGELRLEKTNSFNIPIQQLNNNGKIFNDDITTFVGSIVDVGGYPDSFIFSNKDKMMYYDDLYNNLLDYWKKGIPFHPETFIRHHLNNGVRRIDFGVEILRNNIKPDGTYIKNINNERLYY